VDEKTSNEGEKNKFEREGKNQENQNFACGFFLFL